MKIAEAGVIKKILFKTEEQLKKYLDDLWVRGVVHYVISDGYTSADGGWFFVKVVESDGKHKLIEVEQ